VCCMGEKSLSRGLAVQEQTGQFHPTGLFMLCVIKGFIQSSQ